MKRIIIDDAVIEFQAPPFFEKLDETEWTKAKERFEQLAKEAREIARPRGLALVEAVEGVDGENTRVGQATFKSAHFRSKTAELGRIFPYICTEGLELAEWGKQFEDPLDLEISRAIRYMVLKSCERRVDEKLRETFAIPLLSTMNPGSLVDWEHGELRKLYDLFGELPAEVPVTLPENLFMQPDYSTSGVFFESEKKFYNCQLCPRDGCPNRKARYQA